MQREGAVGLSLLECRDQPIDGGDGGRGGEPQPQQPSRGTGAGTSRGQRRGQLLVGGGKLVAQPHAARCRGDPPAGAVEQRATDRALQGADELADPGLRHVQALGGSPEVQLVALFARDRLTPDHRHRGRLPGQRVTVVV